VVQCPSEFWDSYYESQEEPEVKYLLQLFSYGGVEERTVDSILKELAAAKESVHYSRISGDALITRSRSRAASEYYDREDMGPGSALVMIDHDIDWQPGAAEHIAQKAIERKAIVGGLYCKRTEGKGFSSRLVEPICPADGYDGFAEDSSGKTRIEFGKDVIIKAEYVATGFMAIAWECIDEIVKKDPLGDVEYVSDGAFEYWTVFRDAIVPHTRIDNAMEFLSEDWAFCMRAKKCGFDCEISLFPMLGHTGNKRFLPSDAVEVKNA
jgi:hypothetical protein